MCVCLTPSTCIGITALSYFELLLTPLTYIVFDDVLESRKSQLLKLFRIQNWLNIKKVMSKDV